jgi:hypothetical protein
MRDLALTLAKRIADGGLKVRLYTHGRIHAKLTLVEYPAELAQIAVVGSSDVTLGAPSHPTELNIIVRDLESVRSLTAWYQALWDKGQDFHRELFDELAQSWALNESNPE